MENSTSTQLYDGDGGNAQVEFIMEAETGWEQLMDDPLTTPHTKRLKIWLSEITSAQTRRPSQEKSQRLLEEVGLEESKESQHQRSQTSGTEPEHVAGILQGAGHPRYFGYH